MTKNKLKEIKDLRNKKMCVSFVFIVLIISLHTLNNNLSAQQQQQQTKTELNNDIIIVMVNLERIRTQLLLTEKSLDNGDTEMAFAHATTFPSIKSRLNDINKQFTAELEARLTDLPFNIKAGKDSIHIIKQDISKINNLLNSLSSQILGSDLDSDKRLIAQVMVFLLRDAGKSYQISNATSAKSISDKEEEKEKQSQPSIREFSKVDYENAIGLTNVSKSNYNKISDSIDERRKEEINSFFRQIENSLSQKLDQESVLRLVTAVERDLSEELSLNNGNEDARQYNKYFSAIKTLLSNITTQVKENGNYKEADKNAITAYLDNYEYLEAPIEKHDPQLMADIEIEMREKLRQMIKERESAANIEYFINGILEKIGKAEELLKNDPSFNQLEETGGAGANSRATVFTDIQGLSEGFGKYKGERKEIGEAQDSAKQVVRNNIDQIRKKLDEMLL